MKRTLFFMLLSAWLFAPAAWAHDYDFHADGIYYNILSSDDKTVEVTYKSYSLDYSGDVIIPATVTNEGIEYRVTAIGFDAFAGCDSLTSVTIGENVQTIRDFVFGGCSGLTSITIPKSVTAIGFQAFYGCTGLTSITIPNSVTTIGEGAFYDCYGLTSITIPESVTTISNRTFENCRSLTSITISEGVIAIGDNAFMYCRGLTSVTIPESVQTIGDEVFYGCSGLTEFKGKFTVDNCCLIVNDTLKAFAPNSDQSEYIISDDVKVIGESAFFGCSGLTSVTIPESVTSIDESAFLSCSGLTSVTIGEGVTAIGKSAFSGCEGLEKFEGKWASEDNRCLIVNDTLRFFAPSGLTQYIIPDGVTTIGESAFASCLDLTSVTIPKSVTYIGGDAFYECYGLTSVTAYNPTPVDISTVFYRVDCSNCTLYVPAESVEKYKKAEGWSEFGEILPINESSAITETQQEQAGITVYNLQGVPVLETDDAADLKTLQNGAYIVNGKTMIIAR